MKYVYYIATSKHYTYVLSIFFGQYSTLVSICPWHLSIIDLFFTPKLNKIAQLVRPCQNLLNVISQYIELHTSTAPTAHCLEHYLVG